MTFNLYWGFLDGSFHPASRKLKDQYRSDEFTDPVGAAAQPAKDVPTLELSDSLLTGATEPGVGEVDVFLPLQAFSAP
ncbi:hypothetical protein [Thermobifida halotolerans]|uniref:hypothetical protein n=1 Tax=Thermobifida halotolerans TaxID=483545 RepID=UPI0011C40D64|nr:hypothetical protein [Thermobifida halotolerans]